MKFKHLLLKLLQSDLLLCKMPNYLQKIKSHISKSSCYSIRKSLKNCGTDCRSGSRKEELIPPNEAFKWWYFWNYLEDSVGDLVKSTPLISQRDTRNKVRSRGTSTHLNGFLCLFFSFKFNKSKALWIPSTSVPGDTDINYIATLPKHPLNPTVIDIFGKQLLREKKKKVWCQNVERQSIQVVKSDLRADL